jgi:hypothetical protein
MNIKIESVSFSFLENKKKCLSPVRLETPRLDDDHLFWIVGCPRADRCDIAVFHVGQVMKLSKNKKKGLRIHFGSSWWNWVQKYKV